MYNSVVHSDGITASYLDRQPSRMREFLPHHLIRFCHPLIGLALLPWATAFALLALLMHRTDHPASEVVSVFGLIFLWSSGVYWWTLLRYPYIEAGKAICVSRDGLQGQNSLPFLICYFPGAVSASIACMNMTVNG
ncbi:hypothetical protein ACFQUU_02180 [Herbaspirillum sp. GCM10030257]|uniref:hypothetical protein n=1 Tax=Herbaspirillum sp. GCM10030257 TaxID=3273393 RepID=UPI003618CF88